MPGVRGTYPVLVGGRASFLQAGLDEVTRRYGSVDAYLTEGLGLSRGEVSRLRTKLVTHASQPR